MFYGITNGWATLGVWQCDVLAVEQIGWLRDREPDLYELAVEAESTPGPFRDDPGDVRLRDYQDEQGTRVKRSLVVSSRGDDFTLLLDPGAEPHHGEWPGGDWSSHNPAMDWSSVSFAQLLSLQRNSFLDLGGDDD